MAGRLTENGFSFDWFDFHAPQEASWVEPEREATLKLWFNLEGRGEARLRTDKLDFVPAFVGLHWSDSEPLEVRWRAGENHRFLSLELTRRFLRPRFSAHIPSLRADVQSYLEGNSVDGTLIPLSQLTSRQHALVMSCGRPPVLAAAQGLWFECKAMELAVEFLFQPCTEELFCVRRKRLARERVERVIELLRENLCEPPTLEEIGCKVGCSPFYLSRTFSQELGMTIPQFLRRIRMERAAELLASGSFNVTEAALEVGYSSLSHFSQAFCQTIGCCPNLYPQLKEGRNLGGPVRQPGPGRRTDVGSSAPAEPRSRLRYPR